MGFLNVAKSYIVDLKNVNELMKKPSAATVTKSNVEEWETCRAYLDKDGERLYLTWGGSLKSAITIKNTIKSIDYEETDLGEMGVFTKLKINLKDGRNLALNVEEVWEPGARLVIALVKQSPEVSKKALEYARKLAEYAEIPVNF